MNKIISNVVSILLGNMLGKILFFIFSVIIARSFGDYVFGSMNFANSFITYFIMLSSMGLQTYGIVCISKNKEKESEIFGKVLSTKIILSVFSTVILWIVLTIFNFEDELMILLYGFTIFTNGLNIDWFFSAIQEMKYISYVITIQNIVALLILILSISCNSFLGIYVIPISIIIGNIVSILYSFYVVRKRISYKFGVKVVEITKFISNSYPFFFSGIFATINLNLDTLILGIIRDNSEVGIYNAAYKIINILIVLVSIILNPVYPVMIKLINEKDYDKFSILSYNLKKIMIIIGLPLVLGSLVFSEDIILFTFGKQYIKAANIFRILIIYIALLFVREVYGYTLNASNRQKIYMKIVSKSAFINIILNFFLIPYIGMMGAALTTLISEVINFILMRKATKDLTNKNFTTDRNYKFIFLAFLFSMVLFVLDLLNFLFIWVLLISIPIYGILILSLKIFDIIEIKKFIGGQ